MKIVVLGAVAAGTKTAAKIKREDGTADVSIYTENELISYAGCGLPYYLSGVIDDKNKLLVNTPKSYQEATGVPVHAGWKAVQVNPAEKTVTVENQEGQQEQVSYDKLVIATGARSSVPPIPGTDLKGVYTLRTPQDAFRLREAAESGELKRVCVVGGGFIGLEIAENLNALGIRVSVVEMADQIMTPFDPEMADYLERHLADMGIMTFAGVRVEKIEGEGKVEKVITSRRPMKCDAVILAAGIRPNTEFLDGSGVELNSDHTIKVNDLFETSQPDIYAVGDCIRVKNRMTNQDQWCAMGSTANLEGRLLAMTLTGHPQAYRGSLTTAIVKLGDLAAARCGLTETQAQIENRSPISILAVTEDKAGYYPGSGMMMIKLTAEKESGLLLGAQVIGVDAVDKVIDIAVMALTMKAKISDLLDVDFAYAPPFSTAIHPFVLAAQLLDNKLQGRLVSINPSQLKTAVQEAEIIDASKVPSIPSAVYVDYTTMDVEHLPFGSDQNVILVCNRGRKAYLTQNRLKQKGLYNSVVLEGGTTFTPFDEE